MTIKSKIFREKIDLSNFRNISAPKILTIIAVFSFFLIFGFILRCILVEIDSSDATTVSASAGSSVYYASISNDNSVSIPVTPTSTQAEYTATNTIYFSNTCTAGSSVKINTSTADNDLTRTGEDSGVKTISAVAGDSSSGLTNNTWGFKTSGKVFSQVPALGDTPAVLYESSTAETNTQIDVIYGVKTDNTMPSGTYTNDVVYTVVVDSSCSQYTLSFDLNGGTGASGVDYSDASISYGTNINLSSYTPTRSGYSFSGWSTTGSSGSASFEGTETSVDVNTDNAAALTLTALWTPSNYTLTYDNQSGSGCTSQTTSAGSAWGTLCTPTKTDYDFLGWYTGTDGSGTEITASTTATSDLTVYAYWGTADDCTVINCTTNTLNVDEYTDYSYTGKIQRVTLTEPGYYKLEAWGAGNSEWYKGGYTIGYFNATNSNTKLYVVVGGAGDASYCTSNLNVTGGFNGGAGSNTTTASTNEVQKIILATCGALSAVSGGGATHIATISGLLPNLSSNADKVLVVAGGAGSQAAGGGIYDSYSTENGNLFGQGTGYQQGYDSYYGGGGYYGGINGEGGSGYLNASKLCSAGSSTAGGATKSAGKARITRVDSCQ